MSREMALLDGEVPLKGKGSARLLSVSVDPDHDTPEILRAYGERFGASERWLFLTGEKEEIRRLSIESFRLGLDLDPDPELKPEEPILHSTRFVLIDGEGKIRGYYEGLKQGEREKLREDLATLWRKG